ncbi:MAG: hypothetical protein H6625_10675 [Bdellovibrionaceae bacterium]|nr:hypothetical protein [Pseudobdellovibrionaceae bacterium]
MKKPRDKILKVFEELDLLLDEKLEMTVIGGSAMILGYSSERMTHDVDSIGKISKNIIEIWTMAQKKSGVNLMLDTSTGVAQFPSGYEDRLIKVDLKLKVEFRISYITWNRPVLCLRKSQCFFLING